MENNLLKDIICIYYKIKNQISNRILQFKNIWIKGNDFDIFIELIFCILTPQSKAIMADRVINNLKVKNLIFCDDWQILSKELNLVRFKNNKAKYIINARKILSIDNNLKIKDKIDINNIYKTREWFVKNIKGIGYKEASHFLRNIGFCENICILDRHILKNLKLLNVINEIPKTITPAKYFDIEDKMKQFSNKINIPLEFLDFVLWYKETNEIFK